MLFLILLATFTASIVSLLIVTGLLLIKKPRKSITLALTSFATGVLLATAFFDLFPQALAQAKDKSGIFIWSLFGMVVFFLFEQFFHWYHDHRAHGNLKPSVLLITFGDGLHNFIDGIAIAASFMTNIQLGVATSIAVFAHEIPHEIADVSVYIHQGIGKKKTILFNAGSGLTALLGALLTFFFAAKFSDFLPAINAFTAGNFIYIAGSDLIPELHHATENSTKHWKIAGMFLLGILLMRVMQIFLGE